MTRSRSGSMNGSSLQSDSSEDEIDNVSTTDGDDKNKKENDTKGCSGCLKRTVHALWKTRDLEDTSTNTEAYITTTIRELVIYLLFLTVLGILSFGMSSTLTYYLTNVLKNYFLTTPVDSNAKSPVSFSSIGSFDDYFNVLKGPILNSIYVTSWYNQQDMVFQDRNFVLYENRLLGVPRLRQMRVRNDSCKVASTFKKDITECYADYSSSTEDKSAFGPNSSTAWRYTPKSVLQSSSITATISSYNSGSYYIDLSRSIDATNATLNDLFNNLWLRRGTRAVIIDLTLYNANINLFCVIKLIAEFPAASGVVIYSEFRTVKLLRYVTPSDYAVLGCEVLYFLFILYYMVEEAMEIKKIKLKYFLSFWNILDVLVIVISIICGAFNVYRTLSVSQKLDDLLKDNTVYPDFDFLSYWQLQFNSAVAVTIFIAWIKLFKYISFNKTLTQLTSTLNHCSNDLGGFAVMFTIVFLAFAQLGYLIFGYQVSDYQTFTTSIFSLFRLILGDFNFPAMQQANPVIGPLFFCVYVFFVFFILLNMFIAIINDSYADVKEELEQQKNDFEMGDYFKKKAGGVLKKLNVKGEKLSAFQKAFQTSDLNDDQVIDFDEWKAALLEKGYEEDEIEAVFARYDVNGDRVLDQIEQAKLLEELEGMKAQLALEIEEEKRMVMFDDDSDNEENEHQVEEKQTVTLEKFASVTGRLYTLENLVASIIGKIDVVLDRMEEMEKARMARRQASAKLLDTLTKAEHISKGELQSIVDEEMRQFKEDNLNRFGSTVSMQQSQRNLISSSSNEFNKPH